MTEKDQANREYFIKDEEIGTFVTDVKTQQRFFRVGGKGGQWFWLTGEGNPFDEDVILPLAAAEYLSGVVEVAKKERRN